MNWTTTTVPLWQLDCENFLKTGRPFELRDVDSEEHRKFIRQFGEKHGWDVEQGDDFAFFFPCPPQIHPHPNYDHRSSPPPP